MLVATGKGVVTSAGGCITCEIERLEVSGAGTGFEAGGGTVCHLDAGILNATSGTGIVVTSTTTLSAIVGTLNATGSTAYNVAVGSTLNIFVASLAGTETSSGTTNISKAGIVPAHGTNHESGGSDAIKLDDLATPDDNTDLNASTSKHGLMQKYPGGTTNFLRADGSFAAPPGGGGGWTGTQVLYVGKHGNDSNAGTDPASPKLTISSAITAASGASSSNPYAIVVMDAGIYAENLVITSTYDWIFIDARYAELNGYIRLEANHTHIRLKRHECTTGYGTPTAAIYTTGSSYDDRSIEVQEVYLTSAVLHYWRDMSSGNNENANVTLRAGNIEIASGTSGSVFMIDSQGSAHIEVDRLDTTRPVYDSDNTFPRSTLKIKKLITGAVTLGAYLIDWAHPLDVEIGYVDLASRCYLFAPSKSQELTGRVGTIEGYSSSYPMDINRWNWQLENIKHLDVTCYGGDNDSLVTLGNGKFFESIIYNQYCYYQFHLPTNCLRDSWELYLDVITDTGDTTMYISWKGNWSAHGEPYNTHSGSSNSVSFSGAQSANDRMVLEEISSIFTTKPLPGDAVNIGLGVGTGSSGCDYHFGTMTLRYWENPT